MSILELVRSVQFISAKGKRFAIIDAEEWEMLIDWLENLEDAQILQEAASVLSLAEGDRTGAGWLEWASVVGEI